LCGASTSSSTLSETALDTSPPVSSPSSKRQLTQTPVSSRMVAPHFSHFAVPLLALGSESDRWSEVFIKVTRFFLRALHTDTGSRHLRRQDFGPCVRLHRAADCGNAGACCAAVFSPPSPPFPIPQIDWHMTVHRVHQ